MTKELDLTAIIVSKLLDKQRGESYACIEGTGTCEQVLDSAAEDRRQEVGCLLP